MAIEHGLTKFFIVGPTYAIALALEKIVGNLLSPTCIR